MRGDGGGEVTLMNKRVVIGAEQREVEQAGGTAVKASQPMKSQ